MLKPPQQGDEPGFTFRVRYRAGEVDVWIDGQLAVRGHRALDKYSPDADYRPGIGLCSRSPGAVWRFRDLVLGPATDGPAYEGAPPAPR